MSKCYDDFTKEELIKLLHKQDEELAIKKYGLTWDSEKEPEQVVLDCENNLPILKRIADKEIKTDNSDYNILIEGDKIFTEFNGALAEQYVLQQLKTLEDMEVAYWISKSGNAEIDFVIQTDGYVIPVEVKATTNLQAKSLKVYREKFEPEINIRTSLADFEINNGSYNIPLFMAGKFDEILKEGK